MLLQTNSYIVPKDKRTDHARLMRRFRQALAKLGCDMFEVYEQVGANWNGTDSTGRYVQIMRFRDRKHQMSVQNAERSDPVAQAIINEFCDLVNFPYQQQQGFFAVGFYNSVLSGVAASAPAAIEAADGNAPKGVEPAEDTGAGTSTTFDAQPVLDNHTGQDPGVQAVDVLPEAVHPHTTGGHTNQDSPSSYDPAGSPGDPFDFDQAEEPLSEDELARELAMETPPARPTPQPPAQKPSMFRRETGQ